MESATEENLHLEALHKQELYRRGRIQEQEREHIAQIQGQTREHIAQIQAQTREHRKNMLDLEHQAVHDAAITRQEALNQQEYEHRKRMLKLERQFATGEIEDELRQSVSESENLRPTNEAVIEPEPRFSESQNAGSGNENLEDQKSGKGRLKAEDIRKFAEAAAKRVAEKKRGQ